MHHHNIIEKISPMYRKTFVYKHTFVYKQSGLDSKKHIECQSNQTNQKKTKISRLVWGRLFFVFFCFFGVLVSTVSVSFATVHIQVCTWGKNKLRGPERKPVKQVGNFSLVKRCYGTIGFAMKYCIGPMSIGDTTQFNFDRLRHAQTIGRCLLLCWMPL